VQAEIELLRVVMRRLFGLIDKEEQPASIAATLEILAWRI
jgi:hypothetical protein